MPAQLMEGLTSGQGLARRRPLLSSTVGFATGVLGNLVAGWIEQEWLNPFRGLHIVVILLLTIGGLAIGSTLQQASRVLPAAFFTYRRATIVVVVSLAVALATGISYWLLWNRPCDELRVAHLTLFLGTPRKYALGEPIVLDSGDMERRSNLSGKAVFSSPGLALRCRCEWWGKVNGQALRKFGEIVPAPACGFAIDLDNAVKDIGLKLNVGDIQADAGFDPKRTFDFRVSRRDAPARQ